MDLTPKEMEKFIQLVFEHPALYNPKDMRYKDKLMKETIWAGIGQKVNKCGEACMKCWRNLKDSYTRFRRRCKETGRIDKRANHRIYKQLTFLEEIVDESIRYRPVKSNKNGNSKANLFTSTNPIIVGMEHAVFNKPIKHLKPVAPVKGKKAIKILKDTHSHVSIDTTNPLLVERVPPMQPIAVTPDVPKKGIKVIPISPTAIKQRRLDEASIQPSTSNSNLIDIVVPNNVQINEDKAITYFATHIEEVLRNLPPLLQIQAKQEMFRVITKYELMAVGASKVPPVPSQQSEDVLKEEENSSPSKMEVEVKVESNFYDNEMQIKEEIIG